MAANLHLFLSRIQHETRLVKEARATLAMRVFSRVRVLGLWDHGLPVRDVDPCGMEVRRVRTLLGFVRARFPSLQPGPLTQVYAGLSFLQYAFAAAWQALVLRPSHISCHNAVLLPIAWFAAKLGGSKLVYVPHELEVERTGLSLNAKRFEAPLERALIKRCALVVVVSEPIAAWYRQRYQLREVVVVRAIPDSGFAPGHSADRARIRASHGVPADALLFIYQGVLAAERGVDDLVQIFRRSNNPRLHLMLMGYGEAEARIQEAAAQCPNIHFQAAVPVDQICRYTAAADVGIFVLRDPLSLSYRLCLPNKFFEYLYAELPVIVSDNLSHLAELVQEHRIGWVTRPEDLPQLIDTIEAGGIVSIKPAVKDFVARNTWASERSRYTVVYGG
ncbi:glycosyltransferase [Ramlibacter sp. AW1]|uniref:Glycosyltransferase n=2 Tax=Ramlibacter aurantiacus TaxID=2801330 RepID=A0A937D695_9BURK|nr:glycosyltransferase [Ramlibacter aurantiacus]